eukprot:scaffold769_cov278-Pavlova_lutheri.AAC.2
MLVYPPFRRARPTNSIEKKRGSFSRAFSRTTSAESSFDVGSRREISSSTTIRAVVPKRGVPTREPGSVGSRAAGFASRSFRSRFYRTDAVRTNAIAPSTLTVENRPCESPFDKTDTGSLVRIRRCVGGSIW